MRLLLISLFICSYTSFSQTYFYEDFNYESFEQLDSIFVNEKEKYRWTTPHSRREVDINENGLIDDVELYKKTSILADPFDKNNRIIRYEFNKINPFFFAKYNCDDSRSNNVIDDTLLNSSFDRAKDLYCIDCSSSPLGTSKYEYKTHMMRNEMSTYGSKRKLYRAKRDHWFGMKMLIDEEYELDTDNNGEIVTQFHLTGKGVINPPVSLVIIKGRFRLTIIKNNDGATEVYDLGPVEKGRWIDWKYHIVLSRKDKKGLVEVWRDGEKLATVEGKNTFKNYRMYLKIGIYKWGWWECKMAPSNTNRKVISFDKVWASNIQL